jgi:colanic acid/amylovoran biosynthesis glycosyltransferase
MASIDPSNSSDCILLVLPIHAFQSNGRVYIDDQACDGLRLWLENFKTVIFACVATVGEPPADRSPIDRVPGYSRLRFVGLPEAYTPHRFAKAIPHTSRLLSKLIDGSDHLHFAIGGLWGDWASVASLIASRKKRPYAVWTDRVESQVAFFGAKSTTGLRHLYQQSNAVLMRHYERYVIKKSQLGLFHGMDCFEAYAPYSINPHLVHDIHLSSQDGLTDAELVQRQSSSLGRLQLAYAGRAHREKGIFDWIEALKLAHQAGANFDAVWFGEGPDREKAISVTKNAGLQSRVQFPGSISDHRQLISRLKQFDAFLFAHKTPESPRCLIEALVCGLPLIGYDSPYARDLIRENGGGKLTPIHHPELLATSLLTFQDEQNVLTRAARKDGLKFSAEGVFRHRSELMRTLTQ